MVDTTSVHTPPSAQLIANLRHELMQWLPFARMRPEHVDTFCAAASAVYFAPGETVLDPSSGRLEALLCLRSGSVVGRRGLADTAGSFEYTAGDLFPVGALLAGRAVSSHYVAQDDVFCLRVPAAAVQSLLRASPPFADFLNGRVAHILELSRQAMRAHWAGEALAVQSLETRLAELPPRAPLSCTPETPLAQALARMHLARVGSVLVLDGDGSLQGILTRHDILGRVTLPQLPLDTPICAVMSTPVQGLDEQHSLHDAALLMSRHGIRHVPVLREGRVVNVVSERDLFRRQQLSLKQLGADIRAADDAAAWRHQATRIRAFAHPLLQQGVGARQLTELISQLNDLLTAQVVAGLAAAHGLTLDDPQSGAAWLAFGSEGRGEQTVATDQDNGIVFAVAEGSALEVQRERWRCFGQAVNEELAACGYPLCKGGVMAGQAACCLSVVEWCDRIGQWIERGEPEDLLKSSIYADVRGLAGPAALVRPLQLLWSTRAVGANRFLRLMAENALRFAPPLNWRGALENRQPDGRPGLDLKRQGTAIFVDAARLHTLAHGLRALGTRERLEAVAPILNVPTSESGSWLIAFDFLQMLRLKLQLAPADSPLRATAASSDRGDNDNPNLIDVEALSDIDRRMLKESIRVARSLQQRLEMDFLR
jgi:CBS domain-containing protein